MTFARLDYEAENWYKSICERLPRFVATQRSRRVSTYWTNHI